MLGHGIQQHSLSMVKDMELFRPWPKAIPRTHDRLCCQVGNRNYPLPLWPTPPCDWWISENNLYKKWRRGILESSCQPGECVSRSTKQCFLKWNDVLQVPLCRDCGSGLPTFFFRVSHPLGRVGPCHQPLGSSWTCHLPISRCKSWENSFNTEVTQGNVVS